MSKIKICGLRRPVDVEMVNRYHPDYAGFIQVPGRMRNVPEDVLAVILPRLDKTIKSVGVFVNEERDVLAGKIEKFDFDLIQLHGQESEEYISWLKKRFDKPVIKAVSVKTSEDILSWKNSIADYLLLDNGGGGTGQSFDWKEIVDMEHPFFMAGGINSDNVVDALKHNPFCIDASGGVETDGFKDENKIKILIEKVRN